MLIAVQGQPRLSRDSTLPECLVQIISPFPAGFPVRKRIQRGGLRLAQGYSFIHSSIQQILNNYLSSVLAPGLTVVYKQSYILVRKK